MDNRKFIAISAVIGLLIGSALFAVSWALKGNASDTAVGKLISGDRPFSYNTGIQNASPAVVSIYSSETIYKRPPADARSSAPKDTAGNSVGNSAIADPYGLNNSISPGVRRQTNQGSGVIINQEGYVLTNNHLVQGADSINVALTDGRLFVASIIGADPETDLAVLKINAGETLPSCNLDHNSSVRVGDIVLAIGHPFGVGQTVTQGIVSALSRHVSGTSRLQHFLQIDAAINPGNSGGALINPKGDLVGINTAIFSRENGAQGIGFAIPAELIRKVVPEIIAHGRVIRGWLGIGADNLQLHPDLYHMSTVGAVISAVFESSPAHKAGLRRGDIVTQVNGETVQTAEQLLLLVSDLNPGDVLDISGLRQKQPIQVTVPLAERPQIERNS